MNKKQNRKEFVTKEFLIDFLEANEERLMTRILNYAIERNYSKYTSTLKEPWRLSISGLSKSMIKMVNEKGLSIELTPDEDYSTDPAAEFGIKEAILHRERGVNLSMFLGLMKYYQQAYIDLLEESKLSEIEQSIYKLFIIRFFDRIEIGFCSTWGNNDGEEVASKLRKKNREMTNEKNKYLTIFESINRPIFFVNKFGFIEDVNYSAAKFLDLYDSPGENYYNKKSNMDFVAAIPWIKDIYSDFLYTSKDKATCDIYVEEYDKHFFVSFSKSLDISGKFQGVISVIDDISHRKLMELKLEELSTTDPLTGAKNRRYFNERLEVELSRFRRYKKTFSILLIDIDNFKSINDKYGHETGDMILKGLVDESVSEIRDSDIFARWGGEEFIVLLPETGSRKSMRVAERLRERLSQNIISNSDGVVVNYTVSIGLKVVSSDDQNVQIGKIIKESDVALYEAKENGKNMVVVAR